jgi:hypothetical protein
LSHAVATILNAIANICDALADVLAYSTCSARDSLTKATACGTDYTSNCVCETTDLIVC